MAYRVLLADDSITIQKVVELILSDEDVTIDSVSDGFEALESLSRYRPDVVLADIEMPRMNGYQLCERIKGDPDMRSIPVILLAGAFESFDEDRARTAGADEFIIKPFDSSDLLGKITAVRTQEAPIEELTEEGPLGDFGVTDAFSRPFGEEGPPETEPVAQLSVEPVQAGAIKEEVGTAELVEEAEILATEHVGDAEDIPEARAASDDEEPIEELTEEETVKGKPGPAGGEPPEAEIPSETMGAPPPMDDEPIVISGEDFGDEDLWDAEEIAVAGEFEGERKPTAPEVELTPPSPPQEPEIPVPAEPPPEEPRAAEPDEAPVLAAPEKLEPAPEDIPETEAELPHPVEEAVREGLETEVEATPAAQAAEEPVEVPVYGPEETPAEGPEVEPPAAEAFVPPAAEHVAEAVARSVESGMPDQAAMHALLESRIEKLLPSEASIQDAIERAVSARISPDLDLERQINARLEKFETDLRDSISSTIEKRLVPAFTSSVESILWDVIPQATERLMQETVRDAVSSAVNEKLASISRETIPGLADSLISKIIDKIRTG